MDWLHSLALKAFNPINRHIYNCLMLCYHLYVSLPHFPFVRNLVEVWQPTLPENYTHRKCSTKELRNIHDGPCCIGTSLALIPNGPLEKQITTLCEDAAQILVWAAQTPRVEKLVIYDKSCLLSVNGLELHHTIAAILDKLPTALQRNLSTRYASQYGFSMDLEVVFTDPNVFKRENIDLFISFDGMTHGYPLAGLAGAVIFTPFRRCAPGHGPKLLEYITALKTYEQAMRSSPYLPTF